MPTQDFRARLSPKSLINAENILGPRDNKNMLFPLYQTGGVIFPYTPSVSAGGTAEYDTSTFIHTIYGYNAYVKSTPKPISIEAEFTAQTNDEALYMLAVIQFFRSVTKSYFGTNPYTKAGTPPPVLLFNYLGALQYKNTPVIIKDYSYTLPADIDYVPVYTGDASRYSKTIGVAIPGMQKDGYTYVPTHLKMSIEMDTQYTPIDLRNNFNLDDFRSGKLYNKGYI